MRLGVHIPIGGGWLKALEGAKRLGCNTIQVFSRSPRGGMAPTIPEDVIEGFTSLRLTADIKPLVVHAPYIINLASPANSMWGRSMALLREEYRRCAVLRADFLVVHVGSHMGSGAADGLARVSEAVNKALDDTNLNVTILLENTAGSGNSVGINFEELRTALKGIRLKKMVGVCLDTAHLFAAEHPIHTKDGLENVVSTFDKMVGLKKLKLIHLNDSKVPFGARVDRHWHIGEGYIGYEAFSRFLNHPKLQGIPYILETPKENRDADMKNLNTVRNLIKKSNKGITQSSKKKSK